MSEEYAKPAIAPVAFDFDGSRLEAGQNTIGLSSMDVLGIVQSAFNEIGPANEQIVAIKRAVMDEVSEGKLAHALRTAIVGAAKAGCTCCA
ncbi:hypothetical protein [Erythrobacter colymbi]|uniref:hypothetical protein n=1 Tax=Erythrobacter colymbi TaxID=1161202 RepID=UPI000A3D4C35|nr:hypothetical protein [Erythrobacter colymbi]